MSLGFSRLFTAIVSGMCLGVALGFGAPAVHDYASGFVFLAVAVLISCGIQPLVEHASRTAPPVAGRPLTRVHRKFEQARAERVR